MDAGKLDRRITLQRAAVTRSDLNNEILGWDPPAWSLTVSAAKEDIRDSERIAAQEVGADITTRFTIRWSPDVAGVNPKDRLLFEDRPYGIAGTKEIGRRAWLEITATARADR